MHNNAHNYFFRVATKNCELQPAWSTPAGLTDGQGTHSGHVMHWSVHSGDGIGNCGEDGESVWIGEGFERLLSKQSMFRSFSSKKELLLFDSIA